MNTVAYVTTDVFTSERFAGNPLAVIPDARGLSDEAMQKIATEFNYSEVTFVLPPENPENTARVRIFTPTAEIPFAGHPNVGTAFVLGQQAKIFGKIPGDGLIFEEKAGLVNVQLLSTGDHVSGAKIRAPGKLQVGDTVAGDLIARCIQLDPTSIRHATHAPTFASVGLPFAFAELDNLETLGKARPNAAIFAEAAVLHKEDKTGFSLFVYTRSADNPWHIRARMFAPLDNVIEDPATGSASAALGAYLTSLLPEHTVEKQITIEQGVEMGRRSLIGLDVRKSDGIVTDVFISGQCVSVMRGEVAF
ncbi:PhzF family phenazine biosynthesis protein [Agrobacterium sp. SHOUNA12C]|uniref:Phenazine biosynthesis protein n=1 Tax=Rhizobium rhizogenes NBRC 13257 TaxID=1220581 RepID=A0AA87U5C9_RHIRH|nr:PhzF family phenazine biosynthesis protein [Rhizobium rhizogenes]MCJ9720716.1 PhzF family phenazine biosynthesis protein [Agrobacterium sp. BETTINA12B]MCJ9759981.1 PhzF family phenazine biosynthesis protein [Agrobacterium sp. SHOUNA12C]NTF94800.1 PhzF family phenazine biosynthesis protein [Rhizobium rhizogenes]NTG14880.1 PhzF family phenazine biosynthesis protein [Rhizobium rhizogenes]NTG21714.1 PhzF family phenazine biosynthesis protein [Rhizobium rhizogenes]